MPWREEKSVWHSARCVSAAAIGPSSWGGGLERVGCSQDTLPNLPCPARLSACLLYSLIYSQRSINLPTMWLHPHPSLIQFALICRELHLSLREEGGGTGGGRGGGWGGWASTNCLFMNQGHWKIKAECVTIITDCSCAIILMSLGLTKPCLLYTMASLWDDYC